MRRVMLMFLLTMLAACSEKPESPERPAPETGRGDSALASLRHPSPPPAVAAARGLLTPEQGVAAVKIPENRRASALKPLVDALALSEGIDPALVHAVIRQESSYNPQARSPKGAVGLMQLMPATAQRFGLAPAERTDPARNVRAGIRYLKWLYQYFGHWTLAVAAYNAGEGSVLQYGRRIPPYPETQNYVRRVFGFYNVYRQQQGRLRSAGEPGSRLSALAMPTPRERSREPTTLP